MCSLILIGEYNGSAKDVVQKHMQDKNQGVEKIPLG